MTILAVEYIKAIISENSALRKLNDILRSENTRLRTLLEAHTIEHRP